MAALLITLRETLEASLIVGIMLAFLHRTNNRERNPVIWAGVVSGICTSVAVGWIVISLSGNFEGQSAMIYEGITMLIAATLITWMVLWLATHGKYMRESIEKQMELHLQTGAVISLFLLVYTSILREGIETVIFLHAAFLQSQNSNAHLGAVAGIVIAIASAWLLMRGMLKWFSLSKFFTATGILLMFFAAGLVAHGVHELQEAGFIPILIEHIWDINTILNEKGALGSILKGMFGYNGNPSLLEVLSYMLYLGSIMYFWSNTHTSSK